MTGRARGSRERLPSAPVEGQSMTADRFTHVWRIATRLPARKGQFCRVLAWGRLNSCLVEFPDGMRVVTSRWSVRRRPASPSGARDVK